MGKMMGPRFKKARRLGINFTNHPKAMKRAQRGSARDDRKLSDYGKQLLEKQRLAAYFGVMEKQMRNYMRQAKRTAGERTVPDTLLQLLGRRLDQLVYRAGFAPTLAMARQMVNHKHFTVDGQNVNIPSYLVDPGQTITLKPRARTEQFKEIYNDNYAFGYPFIEKSEDYTFTLKKLPEPEELQLDIDTSLVVEFYSQSI